MPSPPPSLLDWLVDNEPSFRKSRLPSLYSDLSVQKRTNPEGYAANVQAWQAALTSAALAGQLPTEQLFILQTGDGLVAALASPQFGRPSGLGAVIDDSIREGKMIEAKDFDQAATSIYARSWIPSPWSVLRWGLRQAGLGGTGAGSYAAAAASGKLRNGSLVIVPALEDVGKRIESWWWQGKQQQRHLTDRIISREDFAKQLPSILHTTHPIPVQDIDTLLRYLSRDRHLLSYNANAIKFKASETPGAAAGPDPVTAEDSSIANLKQLISRLGAQCATLESTISTQQSRAATFVAQKNRTSALGALRSKKRAEQALERRTATLHQLEDVYHSIEQAVDQIAIVDALQSSATTLKALNNKVGSVDRVEDVLDQLKDQMAKTDEVSAVLQEPLRDDDAVVDIEVDDELEALEREEREREDSKRLAEDTAARLHEAGQVPQDTPGKDKITTDKDGDVAEELARSVEKMGALHLGDA
ncbi:hypothetical protein DV738_g5239, partial [Chaetothyriales sp. CBS 135597]